jgi:hypothetical protein
MNDKDTYPDTFFGDLKWNSEYAHWEGNLILQNNKTVQFSIDVTEKGETIHPNVKILFSFLKEHELTIRAKITDEMIDLYNNTWSNGNNVTKHDFTKRIALEFISFFGTDGDAELFYSDDDLFAGHTITTFLNINGEITEPSLAG